MGLRARVTDLELKVEALRAGTVAISAHQVALKELEASLKGWVAVRGRKDRPVIGADDLPEGQVCTPVTMIPRL